MKCRKKVENCVTRRKFVDAINVLVRGKSLSMDAVRGLYEGMLAPTLLYGIETVK